jgi:hypothetical protein
MSEYVRPLRVQGSYDTVFVTFVRKNLRPGCTVDENSATVLNDAGFGRILVMDTNVGGQQIPSIPNGNVVNRDGLFALSVM